MITNKGVAKFGVFLFIGLFAISMMAGVLAQDEFGFGPPIGDSGDTGAEIGKDVGEAARSVADLWKGFFIGFFDNQLFGEKELLTRVFIALLLAMVVYTAVSQFMGDNKFVLWGATIAITGIALISLPSGLMEAVRLQYGVMGATLLTIIPLAIVLFFTLKVNNAFIGKMTWVFFTMYYFALFIGKAIENWDRNATGILGNLFSPAVIPYTIAIIAGIFMILFLHVLRGWWFTSNLGASMENASRANKARGAGLEAEGERLEVTTGIGQPST